MNTKKIKSVFMLTVMLVATLFSSCTKEEKDVRNDYVGSYRNNFEYTENGQVITGTYTLTIVKSSTNANDILLNNINGWGEAVRATVNGNAMTIPQQTIMDVGISGSGTLNGNVLSFSTMHTRTGGTPVNVLQTATKQ